jgi:hypothetical protein
VMLAISSFDRERSSLSRHALEGTDRPNGDPLLGQACHLRTA